MSKKQRKELTDFQIIEQQFLNFRILENDIDIINIVSNYCCRKNEIGITTEHIKYNTYKEIYNNTLRDEGFTILLTDDSIISMQYIFDDNGKLKKHTLSFLPNYKRDILSNEEEPQEDAVISSEEFSMRLSNYMRIDYGELGRKDYYHALVHLHIGVFRESMRIPLQSFLYPNDFLFFIFKYIYHLEDEKLLKLECDIPKQCLLRENELKKLRMAFGNCASDPWVIEGNS